MNRACFSKNTSLHEQNQHASCIRPLRNNFVLMKKIFAYFVILLFIGCSSKQQTPGQKINEDLLFAAEQYKGMISAAIDNKDLPKTIDKDGKLVYASSSWWTSGFIPGSLWYLYNFTEEFDWLDNARLFTAKIEKEKNNKGTHDLGFMLHCSFGNGYKFSGDTAYKRVLLTGAKSLSSRFNKKVGCIQSWEGNKKWQYPVIIDNMMNLELLLWAFKETKDSTYYRICISHADTTMKNHFRSDFSTYHLVSYDSINGRVLKKQTVQGANDSSAWARGQSWGLYGYTVMYRETKFDRYLLQARRIAEFLINHKNMPADKIPYWDYNAPGIPSAKRDASAAAIMASALIELSGFVKPEESKKYLEFAKQQIISLSSPQYRAKSGENGNFILMHSVGNMPANSEIDVPLPYADYYYIEALLRLREKL
jgi:unsaturated chondroitin disaccharide hydrolase